MLQFNNFLAPYSAFITGDPSKETMQAITDANIWVIQRKEIERLTQENRHWVQLLKLNAENEYLDLEKRFFQMQKKILVINGHPYEKSYVSNLFCIFVNKLDPDRFMIKNLDLGKINFDPVLRFGYAARMSKENDIELSQELLEWAEHIVFFYPVWWTSMPALLKGWLDRVLTPGFAYNMNGLKTIKHLKGRTAQLFLTGDAPALYQRLIPNSPSRLMKKHILGLCGIKVVKSDILGMATWPNKEKARRNFIKRVEKRAVELK